MALYLLLAITKLLQNPLKLNLTKKNRRNMHADTKFMYKVKNIYN